jgi:hypothetical protein
MLQQNTAMNALHLDVNQHSANWRFGPHTGVNGAVPTFRRNLLPSSSAQMSTGLGGHIPAKGSLGIAQLGFTPRTQQELLNGAIC